MKQFLLLALLAFFVVFPPTAVAQTINPGLEFVSLELWPDYDQPQLLVLITGVLPADTATPATISLPLPPGAEINAVAQVAEDGTGLLNLEYELNDNTLTFITPSAGFRVEYYQPYEQTGTERNIRFAWTPTTAVAQVVTSIQEPLAAQNFTLAPAADQIQQLDTGFRYHLYNPQSLTAGQPLFIEINYDLPTNELTEALASANAPLVENPSPAEQPTINDGLFIPDWALFAGAFALLAIALLFFASAWRDRQQKQTAVKPKRQKAGRYCGTCGTAVGKNNKFCPQCGSPIP